MKRYRIGEMADLVGLPTHVLRYYEDQGLVEPRKDRENNYRYYAPVDGCYLLAGRMYRSLGFSVEETRALLNEASDAEISAKLEERLAAVDLEMRRLRQIRRALASTEECVKRIKDSIGVVRMIRRPALYRVGGGINNEVGLDPAAQRIVKRWLSYLPSVLSCYLVERGAFVGEEPFAFNWGHALTEGDFAAFGESFARPMRHYPEAECAYSIIEKEDTEDFRPEHFRFLVDYLEAEGLRCSGPCIGSTICVSHDRGRELTRFSIAVPVERTGAEACPEPR